MQFVNQFEHCPALNDEISNSHVQDLHGIADVSWESRAESSRLRPDQDGLGLDRCLDHEAHALGPRWGLEDLTATTLIVQTWGT